jgi:hypothetical protein
LSLEGAMNCQVIGTGFNVDHRCHTKRFQQLVKYYGLGDFQGISN